MQQSLLFYLTCIFGNICCSVNDRIIISIVIIIIVTLNCPETKP